MQQRIQAEKSKSGGMDGGLGTASVIGLDLGDKWSRYCVLDHRGVILEEDRVRTGAESLRERFGRLPPTRMVIEAGAHSPWVSRLLESIGHSVVVANARKVRLIYESDRKNDRLDARMLARLGRVDVELLAPVRHRGAQAQIELQCNLRILIHSTARFRNSTQSARVGAEL